MAEVERLPEIDSFYYDVDSPHGLHELFDSLSFPPLTKKGKAALNNRRKFLLIHNLSETTHLRNRELLTRYDSYNGLQIFLYNTRKNLGGRTGTILRPSSVALKSKNQEINRLQLAVKLPWAIFFESVDILS
ncbi:hypothetical protein TNCV_1337601 [Trichonephila clavipes]|nr:hypothetical protein TNCV_1337601 [Trichonephila clavipes]